MATAQQVLQAFQALADKGEQDKLPPDLRQAFDGAMKRGLIQDNRGFIAKTVNPRKEDLPELAGSFSSPEEALAAEQKLADPNASIGTDTYGNPIIESSRGRFYVNAPGISLGDVPRAISGAESVAKDVAPYLAAGAATAPAKALVGAAVQGLTGLATESTKQAGNAIAGREVQLSKLATTPLFAIGGDLAGRAAMAVVTPIVSRIIGKRPNFQVVAENGTLTDDAINALDDAGVSPDDFDNLASFELAKLQNQGVLTKEQAERFNFFKNQGLDPTTAQVTRTADDFMAQQELAKRSTDVRTALESQEAALSEAFDTRIRGAGGTLDSSGSPISDAVLNKAATLDSEIGRLYQEARASLPGDRNIRLGKFHDTLRAKGPSNQASGGIISSIRGYLKDAGLQGGTTTTVGASGAPVRVSTATPVGVQQAENLRIELNRLYGNANKEGRAIIRSLKDAIDEDVLKVAGTDYFEQARAAKTAFESGLRPQLLSKFDTNEASLVRDILDNSIRGDEVFNQVALSRSWKPSDVKELKSYLTTGSPAQLEAGAAAWSDLRAQTIQWIKNQAFKGPVDSAGNQAMSRAGLESAISRIGRPRLSVILSKEEAGFIDDMLKLAKLREPVRGTAMGRGPSAQAIKALEDKISGYPLIGGLWNAIKTGRQTSAALNPTAKTVEAVSAPATVPLRKELFTGPGAAAGASLNNGR